MRVLRTIVAALALLLTAAPAWAARYTKKTKVTISMPVQVPGATLPPGTYVFKLAEVSSNRHIVQITNLRGTRIFATILAIPDYRISASSKTVMYFTERGRGTSMAVKSWFYPGDNFGDRFVYPRIKAMEIALLSLQPVPTLLDADVTMAAPVRIVVEKKEVAYVPSTFDKYDALDIEGVDGDPVEEAAAEAAPAKEAPAAPAVPPAPKETPKALPKTASPVFAVGALGALLLGVAALARFAARRSKG